MRSKYATYPEYHTSLDNMDMISPSGLQGGYTAAFRFIEAIENDCIPVTNVYCEPQLGKRGLYPTVSTKDSGMQLRDMMNLIAYADGRNSLIEIAEKIGVPVWELYDHLRRLKDEGLMTLSR
jgi:aminopeptidase-like protein